jgi:signal transduction histidine kinase
MESNQTHFLAHISHELRTPLHAIIGFTQIMLDEKVGPLPDHNREMTQDILVCANQLLTLVNDILDLAKLEAGKLDLIFEKVVLSDLIMEIQTTFKSIIISKNFVFNVDISPFIEIINTDKTKLRRIIYNYLSNAFKFTPDGGKITLRILPIDHKKFQIDVEDTGIGIAEDDIANVFIEYQQFDLNMTNEYAGTGLGLALAKQYAEALGGEVSVRSSPGKGSIFSAILPIGIT